jgi:hypothetical protein
LVVPFLSNPETIRENSQKLVMIPSEIRTVIGMF